MNAEDRKRVEAVLQKIPQGDWDEFLSSAEGKFLRLSMRAARAALDEAGVDRRGRTPKPTADIVHMLGADLLGHATAGPKVRSLIVRALSPSRWERLRKHYRELAPARGEALHGNMVQDGAGADVVSAYWHRGSHWARRFCEVAGLPPALAQPSADVMPEDEVVVSSRPLPPLHDFQVEVYRQLRRVFARGTGSAVLALPTGAGKTRVVVEAVLDHLAQSIDQRRLVLWLAQTDELLRQAWACFRDVWQTAPLHADGRSIPRYGTLRLVRAWGGRRPNEIALEDERTVVLATPHQLASWLRSDPDVFASWPTRCMAAAIIDEAHRAHAPEHRNVLVAIGLRKVHGWEVPQDAPPVIGLTATPWRSSDEETRSLQRYFRRLITPRSLERRPIPVLQRRGILARVTREVLRITGGVAMTPAQRRRYEVMHELPPDYLEALGRDPTRNGRILRQLLKVTREKSVLVFACSIEHANVLTLALNKAGRSAACVTAATRRNERLELLHAFQQGDVQILCNVGVLTTGFDAPRVDVVCLTRPTASALLYEQMVGRGLRGPKNGGTTECTVLDVQDEGLPDGIMSYERVLALWGG